jgi:hypothetical protein
MSAFESVGSRGNRFAHCIACDCGIDNLVDYVVEGHRAAHRVPCLAFVGERYQEGRGIDAVGRDVRADLKRETAAGGALAGVKTRVTVGGGTAAPYVRVTILAAPVTIPNPRRVAREVAEREHRLPRGEQAAFERVAGREQPVLLVTAESEALLAQVRALVDVYNFRGRARHGFAVEVRYDDALATAQRVALEAQIHTNEPREMLAD